MFTDECSYTKCFHYICIVNDLLYEKRKIKEMKVKKKRFQGVSEGFKKRIKKHKKTQKSRINYIIYIYSI